MAASLATCNGVCSPYRNPARSNSRRLRLSTDSGASCRGNQAAAVRPLQQQPTHTVVRPNTCVAIDCSTATVLIVQDLS